MRARFEQLMHRMHRSVSSELLNTLLPTPYEGPDFDAIGDIHCNQVSNTLSYLKSAKYIPDVLSNELISAVICNEDIAKAIGDRKATIICDDPNFIFFSIVDKLAEKNEAFFKSEIALSAQTDLAIVSPHNVIIGENVLLEPNVIIHPGVIIANNVTIRSGAVLGLDSFQHQRTSHGILSPRHDGLLFIDEGTEIGAHGAFSKGFSYRPTYIGRDNKFDAHSYVAHGVRIGDENIICVGTRIMGHTKVGNGCFIGPNSAIASRLNLGDKCRISIGSVVTKDVAKDKVMSGNFAVSHDKWLSFVKSIR